MRLWFHFKLGITFVSTIALTIIIIVQNVRFLARSWLPARSIVMQCLEARLDVDPSGEILVLDRFCPVSKLLPALSVMEFIFLVIFKL